MTNPKRRDNINVLQGVLIRRITKFIQRVIKLENSRIVFQENLTEMRLLNKSVLTTFLHLFILSTTLRGVDHVNAFDICKNASYCCARKYEFWRQHH